jgi:putative peptidoglycan lipid II flippase
MAERFERHSWTFAILTFVSRVGGLAREAVLSRVFGAGAVMDAFNFAFLIPNLFRRLFGEGALSAAFVPVYTRLHRDDPETARRLATLTVGALVALLGALTLAAEGVLALCLRGAGDGGLELRLTMIMLPYMPMICAVAILGAMLQVHGRFGPTAASPILLNVCEVAAAVSAPLVLRDDHARITLVAVSVLARFPSLYRARVTGTGR